MRKVVYYVSTTVDGFMEGEDGSWEAFVWEGPHVTDYLDYRKQVDIVLMGRRTYENGLKQGVTNPYPAMQQYVFSRTLKESPDPNVTIVSEGAVELVTKIKQEDGKDIWLCGAGDFAATLFAANLVDQIYIKLNPAMIGAGVPLIRSIGRTIFLELHECKDYGNNVLLLKYNVKS
jgi:dihydrofolate reductase